MRTQDLTISILDEQKGLGLADPSEPHKILLKFSSPALIFRTCTGGARAYTQD